MDTLSLNDSTIAYLTARYARLQDMEKLVSVLMDFMVQKMDSLRKHCYAY